MPEKNEVPGEGQTPFLTEPNLHSISANPPNTTAASAVGDRVVCLTPAGRGAVATVLTQGTTASQKADRLFHSAGGRSLPDIPVGRVTFGTWQISPDRREEVVVCRRGDRSVEIHCHGGRVVTQSVIDSLVELDCEPVSWQEWLESAESDSLAAAARAALAEARTQRAAAILLDQYRGALREAVCECISLLTSGNSEAAVTRLETLHHRAALGKHLTQPWRIVVAGQPNVGKSSLINSILGYERSIVFDQPGTTRDVVTATTALDGWPVELRDTAGLRIGHDEIEAAGVALARDQIAAADLVVLVFDASRAWTTEDDRLRGETQSIARRTIVVHNKQDVAQRPSPHNGEWLVSAKTGQEVDRLIAAISSSLVSEPPAGAAVPFTCEQAQRIDESLSLAKQGDPQSAAAMLDCLLRPNRETANQPKPGIGASSLSRMACGGTPR